jgi:hypothetical protein
MAQRPIHGFIGGIIDAKDLVCRRSGLSTTHSGIDP